MKTATPTQTFTRAIHVERSDTGCYAFAGREMFFSDVISYQSTEYEWETVELLAGWGGWTHAICVTYGFEQHYYFAR